MSKTLLIIIIILLIAGAIWYLESRKRSGAILLGKGAEIEPAGMRESAEKKAARFPRARELVSPSGFINTDPVSVQEFIGKKVVLIDFWTYSCINCQRTLPYLNAWHEKYKDQGLIILGVHTPEFAFEKDIANVQQAVQQFAIQYPVILDNDYGTWNAYQNRYWPRKYLIDIDGFIVYDHIGEGAYYETERKIQELLKERMEALNAEGAFAEETVKPDIRAADFAKIKSPETYFGSLRNQNFGNGTPGKQGMRVFEAPQAIEKNKLYLSGDWDIAPEFAENKKAGSKIIFQYEARDVFLVAHADAGATLRIFQDGNVLNTLRVQEEKLYHIISGEDYGEHTLEIIIDAPGLRAFAFTFG